MFGPDMLADVSHLPHIGFAQVNGFNLGRFWEVSFRKRQSSLPRLKPQGSWACPGHSELSITLKKED